jgi:DNA topoisomerase VI subunit B
MHKIPESQSCGKAAKLARTAFQTSRKMEFCSEKELTNQVGHDKSEWPLVVLKELVDNALDAAEEAGVVPEIAVTVTPEAITVADNGPGIPAETIDGVLNFDVRASSREAYVAPDRGAQGNALKTIVAMPFVLDGNQGYVEIATGGQRHTIEVTVDPIRQEPDIRKTTATENVRIGTSVTVHWPDSASSLLEESKADFLQFAEAFTFLNPHLTLTVDWCGDRRTIAATAPAWRKWKPSDPTSAHWYRVEDLERLIAAYIVHDQNHRTDRFVRDFVGEFRGLSGTAKQGRILQATGLTRMKLSALANGDGFDRDVVAALLTAMQENSKPVKPRALGVIGRDHLWHRFEEVGCEMASFQYKLMMMFDEDELPMVLETAFAWRGDSCPDERRLIAGVNWSPGIDNPFRTLGDSYGDGLSALLTELRVGEEEPVIFFLHYASPRVQYTDRGKTAIVVN